MVTKEEQISVEKVTQVISDHMNELQRQMSFYSEQIEGGGKYADYFAKIKDKKLEAWVELFKIAHELELDQ